MGIAIDEKSINKMLGEPTDISGIEKGGKNCITRLAFELYKEVASISTLVSNMFESNGNDASFNRNQAINIGLIVRITKYMRSVLTLLCDKVSKHGEVIMTLNRCIVESAIKLKFFCEKATQEDYNNFVKSSLKPEKEAYEKIKSNIQNRGNELPIEKRMLSSIKKTISLSGCNVDNLDFIPQFIKYKDILKILGMEDFYSFAQSIPSHGIHGNWVDLLLHHLESSGDNFRPKLEPLVPDSRLICPINVIILDALKSYLNKYFVENDIVDILFTRINDIEERNSKVENYHESSLS